MNYTNGLQISQEAKGIPYRGSGEVRPDGGANHGFTNLKGSLERIADIPELQQDEALRDLVVSLNRPGSAFATVGCVSGLVQDEQGHRVSGYVEFAFDCPRKVADAGNYFPVFFHFDRALHLLGFDDRVHFHWELMGASFIVSRVQGFTMTVTVNTGWYPTAQDADIAWANGLDFLGSYLSQVPREDAPSLFNDDMDPDGG